MKNKMLSKKNLIVLLLLVTILLTSLVTTGVMAATLQNGPSITVSDIEMKTGSVVTVDITLDQDMENIINFSLEAVFDPSVLEIVKEGGEYAIKPGPVFTDQFLTQTAGNNADGYANFAGTATAGQDLKAGVIYQVSFKVLKEADTGLTLTVAGWSQDKARENDIGYVQMQSQFAVKQSNQRAENPIMGDFAYIMVFALAAVVSGALLIVFAIRVKRDGAQAEKV